MPKKKLSDLRSSTNTSLRPSSTDIAELLEFQSDNPNLKYLPNSTERLNFTNFELRTSYPQNESEFKIKPLIDQFPH